MHKLSSEQVMVQVRSPLQHFQRVWQETGLWLARSTDRQTMVGPGEVLAYCQACSRNFLPVKISHDAAGACLYPVLSAKTVRALKPFDMDGNSQCRSSLEFELGSARDEES
jgi:hypothetical protein